MANPFSITFGEVPYSFIERPLQNARIVESFTSENPEFRAAILTGVRGSGKTVALNDLAQHFKEKDKWTVVSLDQQRDLLKVLATKLQNKRNLWQRLQEAKVNVSIPGVEFQFDKNTASADPDAILDNILEGMAKAGQNLLVTVDEVDNTQNMRDFVSQFQLWLGQKYKVFLLMAGLPENVDDLQTFKTLTFLYRTPKFYMEPLNLEVIARNYQKYLELDYERAAKLAGETKGYPFAYQALGNAAYKNPDSEEETFFQYDMLLEEYVYNLLWRELSGKDRSVLKAMDGSKKDKVKEIQKKCGMKPNKFSVYRNRLIRKGIIQSQEFGTLSFALPRFSEFVKRKIQWEE